MRAGRGGGLASESDSDTRRSARPQGDREGRRAILEPIDVSNLAALTNETGGRLVTAQQAARDPRHDRRVAPPRGVEDPGHDDLWSDRRDRLERRIWMHFGGEPRRDLALDRASERAEIDAAGGRDARA